MSKRVTPTPHQRYPGSVPPSGTVTGTCCPKFAGTPKWHGAAGEVTSRNASVRSWVVDPIRAVPTTFGWDDRTNLPNAGDRGSHEYWLRPGAPGTSGGSRDRDGSAWVSVGVGGTGKVEIRFAGHASTSCISNVSVAVSDPAKATVTPTAYAGASVRMIVTGVAAGECTVTFSCNGAPIGWFHVAVYPPRTANLSIFRVNLTDAAGTTNLTTDTPFSASDVTRVRDTMNDVYAQCAVSWNITNGGVITYTTPGSVSAYNASLKVNSAPDRSERGTFFSDATAANPAAAAAPAYNLYYMQPRVFGTGVTRYTKSGGVADGIPSNRALIYAPLGGSWGRSLLPHEIGHCLGLYHPNDNNSSSSQMPDNFRLPLVADPSGSGTVNCSFDDHINLMGYGADPPPMSAMRYGQWETVQGTLSP